MSAKLTKTIPAIVRAKLEGLSSAYALVLLLDNRDAFIEITASTNKKWHELLLAYKTEVFPSIKRSDYRLFVRIAHEIEEISDLPK